MSRGLSGAMLTAIADTVVRALYLVEIEFESLTLRLSSGLTDVSWNSQTWLANGFLYSIDGMEEATEIAANGFSITLGGGDSTLISLALGSTAQSKRAKVYLGLLDTSNAIIADPEQVAHGLFDYAELRENGSESRITLHYESNLLSLKRVQEFRYTHLSQQALFPGDLGFIWAHQAEDWSGFWGKSPRKPKERRKRKQGRN